jgi:hypothetical protein
MITFQDQNVVGTDHGFTYVASSARLIDHDLSQLQAWAENFVRVDPDIKWLIGNYVEADQPNGNGHIFPLDELVAAQHTLPGKPLNMLHREHYIVGYFAGAQLLTSGVSIGSEDLDQAKAESKAGNSPYIEALAAIWHHRFPEEFFNIRRAHAEGSLYFSMEAVPARVSCPSCGHDAEFGGVKSNAYCDHMQGSTGPKILHRPIFNGGAIIIPPVKPGWSRADITTISRLLEDHNDEAEAMYAAMEKEAPHLDPEQWEQAMAAVMVQAREFSTKTRQNMADKGTAMPDGSYPIANLSDLRNAIQAWGRCPPGKRPALKRHLNKRAKALGAGQELLDRIKNLS